MNETVARIFEDVGGYFICNDDTLILDTRGNAYKTKKEAMHAAYTAGYTHGIGSGTYKPLTKTRLVSMISVEQWEKEQHERSNVLSEHVDLSSKELFYFSLLI